MSLDMRGRWYRSNKRQTVDRYQRLDVAAFADLWRDSEAVGLSFPVTWPRGAYLCRGAPGRPSVALRRQRGAGATGLGAWRRFLGTGEGAQVGRLR